MPPNLAVSSAIAACGAGLDRQLTARVEAEYEDLRASALAEVRSRISSVLDPNDASPEKYRHYLDCVLKIHEDYLNKQTCNTRCSSANDACQAETNRLFDLCISKSMRGCVNHCKQFDIWSEAECMTEMCNWASMSQEAKDFYAQSCELTENYIDQVAHCSSAYGQCLAEC